MYAIALICLEEAVAASREGVFFALPGGMDTTRLRIFNHLHLDSRSLNHNLYYGITTGDNSHLVFIYCSDDPTNYATGQKFTARYKRVVPDGKLQQETVSGGC